MASSSTGVTVSELKTINFSSLSLNARINIKMKGRPTPVISIVKPGSSRGKPYTRKVTSNVYEKNDWICGCEETKAFFCFPCLLFGGNDKWVRGVTDPQKIHEAMTLHENQQKHMANCCNLGMLGSVDAGTVHDSSHYREIERSNVIVAKNREVLSRIIDCVRFCGSFEFGLREHKESGLNQGIFLRLVDLTQELDASLRTHVDEASVFKGTPEIVQSELLQCVLEVCREEIVREIAKSDFVAVVVDGTAYASRDARLATVFRYTGPRGSVVERFWGFTSPGDDTAAGVAECVFDDLEKVLGKNTEKLISQSYDGAAVRSGQFSGLMTSIKEKYGHAHYTHCRGHELDLIMQSACCSGASVCRFFANLDRISIFFSSSKDRLSALDASVAGRIPIATPLSWACHARMAKVVHDNRYRLYVSFCKLESNVYTAATVDGAGKMKRIFDEPEFTSWLGFFHRVMPHVTSLCDQLRLRTLDATMAFGRVAAFVEAMRSIRRDVLDGKIEFAEKDLTRKVVNFEDQPASSQKACAMKVCDAIIKDFSERFSFLDHLDAASLFFPLRFLDYYNKFPKKQFKTTVDIFPMLDRKRLRTELELLYHRKQLRSAKGPIPLLKFLMKKGLQRTFVETVKLLKIVTTIPMTTAEATAEGGRRTMSTQNRIKSFLLRNSLSEDRLAMLCIEREFISRIPDFTTRVIEKFASQKERRMDFYYKII